MLTDISVEFVISFKHFSNETKNIIIISMNNESKRKGNGRQWKK